MPVDRQQIEREELADVTAQFGQTLGEGVVVQLEVRRVVDDDLGGTAGEEEVRQVQDRRSRFCQLPVDDVGFRWFVRGLLVLKVNVCR